MTTWTLSSTSADCRPLLHSGTVAVDDVATKATTTTESSDAVVTILFPVGDRRPPIDEEVAGATDVDAAVRQDNDVGRFKAVALL